MGVIVAAAWTVAMASPALAHGDHDARPLARDLEVGPYVVSLWQVFPDAGGAMTPHLIVMVDGGAAAPTVAEVVVDVDSSPMAVTPSTTTASAWETTEGVAEGDVVSVTISDGTHAWRLDPLVVSQTATSMLPMQLLIYVSSALTAVTAIWVAARTVRAWRRPTLPAEST